jgi:2',3'-cyclic-nucleotide 2'-phosphodiesterase (5'-nucleotidase family)
LRARWLATLLLVAAAGVWAADPATGDGAPAEVRVVLLHFNDGHGHIESYTEGTQQVGGYYRLATLLDQVRQEKSAQRVFFIFAGDEFSRADQVTRASRGLANVAIWNHLKLDLYTPGNGDFYDGLAALQERMRAGNFRTLAANVTLAANGGPLGVPYVIESAGPVKIAFFGLCTVRNGDSASSGVKTEAPLATARRLLPELRRQADAVVAVSHLGLNVDLSLAAALDGLDVIVGGHTHSVLRKGQRVRIPEGKEVLVVQAGDHLRYLGRVDLTFRRTGMSAPPPQGWRVAAASAQLLPVNAEIQIDPVVKGLVARLAEAAT